jgi:hypothetical protein
MTDRQHYLKKARVEELVLTQALEHHRTFNGAGLKTLGPCPVCGSSLKYKANDPRLGFIVWCDRVGCLVARVPGVGESEEVSKGSSHGF